MNIQAPEYRPGSEPPRPYVRFSVRPGEDREASKVAGEPRYKDEIWVTVQAAGSKDSTELLAVDWIARLRDHATNGRIPAHWPKEYAEALKEFEADQVQPEVGTSLKLWPAISPAQLKNCLTIGVTTVEALAGANQEILQRLGMGAVGLRDSAHVWISRRGNEASMTSKVAELTTANEQLTRQLEELRMDTKKLEAQLAAQKK